MKASESEQVSWTLRATLRPHPAQREGPSEEARSGVWLARLLLVVLSPALLLMGLLWGTVLAVLLYLAFALLFS